MVRGQTRLASDMHEVGERIRDGELPKGPRDEIYSAVSYSGVNGGTPTTGIFVEVDKDTWIENGIFSFEEVSETAVTVVLYDASRATTITMHLATNTLEVSWAGNLLTWDITGVTQSPTPIMTETGLL